MYKLLITVALLAGVSAGRIPGRIVGGHDTTIQEHPYHVGLNYPNEIPYCGGSIISSEWVLTAAHCISYDTIFVTAGRTLATEQGTVHRIEKMIVDRSESPDKIFSNDIALIKLRDPIVFDEFHAAVPMYEADEPTKVGAMAVVTGWGDTMAEPTDVLQEVSIPIISKERCNELYGYIDGIAGDEICAAYEHQGGKDSCQGDSGGPLTVNGRLAGIVSWGDDCAVPGQPGVYVEVAAHRKWIRHHTGL